MIEARDHGDHRAGRPPLPAPLRGSAAAGTLTHELIGRSVAVADHRILLSLQELTTKASKKNTVNMVASRNTAKNIMNAAIWWKGDK